MVHANDKILTYAIDKEGKLVHIESVPRGLNCGCVCPFCHTELIAKQGEDRAKHFAHKGDVCKEYYETALHLLAKEIIKEDKTVMLPAYKYLKSTKICFKEVEVEERKDSSELQPDCVGITEEGLRIHVEIFVTHKVDERKKEKIEKNGINCVEIRIPNDFPLDREKLKDFIENKDEGRIWINYPYGEEINAKIEKVAPGEAFQERTEKEKPKKVIKEKGGRAQWYMDNAKEWLRTPLECGRCVLNAPRETCFHRLPDIVYNGERYVVCKNMFYKHDNHLGEDGLIPTKDSSGKLTKTIDEAEQRRWDIANGKYPDYFNDCY